MFLKPIGIIHSPYKDTTDAPFQGRIKQDIFELEIYEEFVDGLKDVEMASHLIILYWCDRADRETLIVKTPWDSELHGVFATRSPHRPNPVAFGIGDLVSRNNRILVVRGLDALDKSPLLDIKPYNWRTDSILGTKLEWFDKAMEVKEKERGY